ncbi:DEAD/DEAH box helicase [Prevotella communis]|uniref:DEAD/DEAH box helicase n=1 Tax=Prevotella communis TaxID=2913614 RepID=UPI001EDA4A16|nr:DEAD/DEAH box helicase [Prevotella communis]UKK67545.1 DEAD/DEAH box helicase [Prevotella communis]UKK70308.1 DEAD/DEAH box helicase [Prevotella communis]
MSYRIANIYVEEQQSLKEVCLEVCNEGGSSQISPFVRKVTVSELAIDDNPLTRKYAAMLNNLGFEYQPFRISGKELSLPEVVTLLGENPYSFIQSGNSRSLKKGQLKLTSTSGSFPVANLLGGTLYVTNLENWKSGIEVRFRYQDAVAETLPFYNEYPIRTLDGNYKKRDAKEESIWLETLSPCELSVDGTITLPAYEVAFLKNLESLGWEILYAKGKSAASKVHFKRTSSGIDWFSTDAKLTDDDVTAKLLDAYMHGRNFQQSRSYTAFFSKDDISKQDNESFVNDFIQDENLIEKYKEITLTPDEKNAIEDVIERNFTATLRDYQWDGVYWLATMRKKQAGCILADEMGLGKTLQVLAHLLSTGNTRTLIVVPTSLVTNWNAEILRFILSWDGKVSLNQRVPEQDKLVHIISYDLLRRNISYYKVVHYDTLVLDEAQMLKNDNTQRHKVISQLDFSHGIVMTGTPIENAIDDVWSYFYILMKGMRSVHDRLKKLSDGATNTDSFLRVSSKLLNPFILRRTKNEYLEELPPCTERNIYVTFDKEESETYNRVHSVFNKALKNGISGRVTSIALEALLRLRQACVSVNLLPSSLYKGGRHISTKMQLALGQIQQLGKDDKLIIFSQFVQALEEMEEYLKEQRIPYVSLYGSTTDRETPVSIFQTKDEVKVFLSSIKAGGVGLNLTAADYVLLLDDWWNPAVEAQAFSRAHRIGQKRPVEVMRLICKDTVEEKILALQQSKQQTADVFNLNSGKLSIEELRTLLS